MQTTQLLPLSTIYAGWGRYQRSLVKMLAPLSVAQLALPVPAHDWTIGMVAQHMGTHIPPSKPLRFIDGACHEEGSERVVINDVTLENYDFPTFGPYFKDGSSSALQIVKKAAAQGISPIHTVTALDRFWREGLICNAEPLPPVEPDQVAA